MLFPKPLAVTVEIHIAKVIFHIITTLCIDKDGVVSLFSMVYCILEYSF